MSAWCRCLVFSVAVAGLAAYATPAEGDPIVITSGSIGEFNGEDFPGFQVMGTDSLFQGVLPVDGVLCCTFNAGQQVTTLSRSFPVGTMPGEPSLEIVNNTRFQSVFVVGTVSFTAVPFIAPTLDGTTLFRFTTPFTMQGQIAGYADANFTDLLFSVPLSGSGTAVVLGSTHQGEPNYVGQGLGFNFEAPAATPEPASMALFGAGVAGICLRRLRRRKERAVAGATEPVTD